MRDYAGPIILIGLGIYLLFNQLDYLSFRWADILTYGFILIGFIMFLNAFDHPHKKGILGGVFFMSYGITLSLMRYHVIYPDDYFGYGAFFLALALGNLMYFFFRTDRIINLTWAVIFAAVGAIFASMYFGLFHPWYIEEQVEAYWPLALIVLGLGIIFNAYRKRDTMPVN